MAERSRRSDKVGDLDLKSTQNVRLILLLVAIAIMAIVSYWRTHAPQNANTRQLGGNDLVLRVRSLPITNRLDLGTFVVPDKSSHDVTISVDESRMRNAQFAGHFSTSNAPGIEVLLLDDDQYQRFQKKLAPSDVLYMSKMTTNGNIEAKVPHAGTYHLVFDNSHSESSATVKADVTLHYETVRVDARGDLKK
jgi:hypothetical protein